MTQEIQKFTDPKSLQMALAGEYRKRIENYFGNEQLALEFLSNVMDSAQRIPELIQCTPQTVMISFMKMAQLKLMPSGVSGEAYVLPYKNKGVLEAQFQLGYQGLVTLIYRAGAREITSEIVYEKDTFAWENGKVSHKANPFLKDRGEPIGAYVIVQLKAGGEVHKAMSKDEILDMGKRFSKSFNSEYSPWNPKNDPMLWMWKKTVLKQASKTLPKNKDLMEAIAEDNKDSNIADRMEKAKQASASLTMGSLTQGTHEKETTKKTSAKETEVQPDDTNSIQID